MGFATSYFSGFTNKDVAFFHPASKTMVQADLLFNLPCTEQVSPNDFLCRSFLDHHCLVLVFQGEVFWTRTFNWRRNRTPLLVSIKICLEHGSRQRVVRFVHEHFWHANILLYSTMKRDVKTVAGWNFERIIPCHGVRTMCYRPVDAMILSLFTGCYRKGC